jgi:hypothetical protein
MTKPKLHINEWIGQAPVKGECTVCPYPATFFSVTTLGSIEDNQAHLERRFAEHFQKVHSREDFSQAAARIVREATEK